MAPDRRWNADEAKLSTQRFVTYVILIIFAAVVSAVFSGHDQAERSTIIQTVVNVLLIAVGYWLGASKGSADKDVVISRIVEHVASEASIKADEPTTKEAT